MSEINDRPQQGGYIIPPPEGPNWKTPLLIGLLTLLGASNVYLFTQLQRMKTDTRAEIAKLQTDVTADLEKFKVESSETVLRHRRNLDTLQQQLKQQRLAATQAVGQTRAEAERKVAALEKSVTDARAKQQEAIDAVKLTADTTTTEVGTVKTDLTKTKSELENTVASLRRVTGDVDSHGSLIATNGKELAALRSLGERNYLEFNLNKTKEFQKIGDIAVQLRKADVKRNRYTIKVLADDKEVEKKDKNVNEPVQFYTLKARQPYEIVVNEVKKNNIVGYLSTPKVMTPRN